jgi:hypothetical protein
MKPILLGKDAGGNPVYLTPAMRRATHMHVVGSSGTGKSKFLEWMIRQDIHEGHGFCVIDWHGKLYNDVVRFCAHLDVGIRKDYRRLVLLNPSRPDFITGFNPFMNPGEDISTQVSKRIDATIKPWGANTTNETPTFARLARVLYTFMAESEPTLGPQSHQKTRNRCRRTRHSPI